MVVVLTLNEADGDQSVFTDQTKKWRVRMGRRVAFTLIELLIVVAIIGILAAIAVPNFLNAQIRAKLARVQSDHKSLSTALEAYRVDFNNYPGDSSFGNNLGFRQLTTPISYIVTAPTDPFSSDLTGGQSFGGIATRGDYQLGTGHTNQPGVAQPEQRNIYILASNGPDKQDDSQPIDPFPLLNPTRYIAFEVTNGLVSKGDIWRFGGEPVPAAFRERVSFGY